MITGIESSTSSRDGTGCACHRNPHAMIFNQEHGGYDDAVPTHAGSTDRQCGQQNSEGFPCSLFRKMYLLGPDGFFRGAVAMRVELLRYPFTVSLLLDHARVCPLVLCVDSLECRAVSMRVMTSDAEICVLGCTTVCT